MKTQELVDVRVGESTQPDYGYELSDRCIITKSSNAVASGAGSKGLFSYKSTKLKSAECKINQSLRFGFNFGKCCENSDYRCLE